MKVATTAERLKEIMEKQGLRQVDVINKARPYCEKHGVKISKSGISQCLNYGKEPRYDKVFVLAQALNVTVEYLMGEDTETKSDLLSQVAVDSKAMEMIKMYVSMPEPLKNSFYDLLKSVYLSI